jgi:hypothetical protein
MPPLDLAALTVISALAQPPMVKPFHVDASSIYQSYASGNQTFPNADRDFFRENVRLKPHL